MSDCKNCKHLVMYDYKNKSYSCESRECEFEPEEQEPTTKNDLEVDCISREQAINAVNMCSNSETILNLQQLPSVTPQEPTDKKFTKADIDAIVKAINAHWELIIDEIRAEILEEHENAYAREDDDTAYGLSMALDILDKYRADTEDT